MLEPAARAELRTLPTALGDSVARWLVAAAQAEDPAQAYEYAGHARRLAARVGLVREVCGAAAYYAGEWADALAELRTARRLTGRDTSVPVMADCERALGRPERALALINGPDVAGFDRATQIELRIVESGIRRDQGLPAAAAAALRVPELTDGRLRPWSGRLFYAYAETMLAEGSEDEARDWFARASEADPDALTDAADRFEQLDPVDIDDITEEDLTESGAEPGASSDSEPGASPAP